MEIYFKIPNIYYLHPNYQEQTIFKETENISNSFTFGVDSLNGRYVCTDVSAN